jgi:hypothetical protein
LIPYPAGESAGAGAAHDEGAKSDALDAARDGGDQAVNWDASASSSRGFSSNAGYG